MPVTINPLGPPFDFTGAAGSGSGDVTHTGTLTAHEVILGNGGADIKALGAVGSLGEVLTSGGAGVDPSWQPAGSGTIGGTIADTQIAFGTGPDTIGGDAFLTYDNGASTVSLIGQIDVATTLQGTPAVNIDKIVTQPGTWETAVYSALTTQFSANDDDDSFAVYGQLFVDPVTFSSAGAHSAGVRGNASLAGTDAAGLMANLSGVTGFVANQGLGTLSLGVNFLAQAPINSGGGMFGISYGFYQEATSGANTKYGAYFAFPVGIGTATPTQELDVVGTVVASVDVIAASVSLVDTQTLAWLGL